MHEADPALIRAKLGQTSPALPRVPLPVEQGGDA
jgi:hypothetical protein